METPQAFLFGSANHIRNIGSRKLLIYGFILTCVGLTCILNASIITVFGAVKSYKLRRYFNTHWITSIYLLSGLSGICADRYRLNFFLFLTVVLAIVATTVGVGSIVATSVNIDTIRTMEALRNSNQYMVSSYLLAFTETQSELALLCAVVDLVCNFIGIILCVMLLKEISSMSTRYFTSICTTSRSAVILGILGSVIGLFKLCLWLSEMAWLHRSANIQYHFINYTFDEPIWNVLYMASGLLTAIVGFRGSRVQMHCALLLTTASYFPATYYLWIDYRWLSQVQFDQFITLPKLGGLLWANLVLGLVHLVVIVLTVCKLAKKLVSYGVVGFRFSLKLDSLLMQALLWTSTMLLVCGGVFLFLDISSIHTKTFFRLFWPTEQQLPVALLPMGALSLVVLREPKANYIFLPVVFVLYIKCEWYTLFHIAAYIYLSSIKYSAAQMCDLFIANPASCSLQLENKGSVIHFIEALMAFYVLVLSLFVAIIFGRLMGLYGLPPAQLAASQESRRRFNTIALWIAGIMQFLLSLVLVAYVGNQGSFGSVVLNEHPLFVLHGTIKLVCNCAPFIVCPLVLFCFLGDLHLYPLRSIAILVLYGERLIEMLVLLDNYNIPSMSYSSMAMFIATLVNALLTFFVITRVGLILDISTRQLPEFNFGEEALNGEAVNCPQATDINSYVSGGNTRSHVSQQNGGWVQFESPQNHNTKQGQAWDLDEAPDDPWFAN